MFLRKSSIFIVMLGVLATASQAHAEVVISPDGNQVKAGNVIINGGTVNLSRRRSTRIKKYDRYGRLIKTTVPSIIRSTTRVENDGDEEYTNNRQVIHSTRSTGSTRSTTVQSTTVNGNNRTVISNTSSDY
jgi:hypothetical protein